MKDIVINIINSKLNGKDESGQIKFSSPYLPSEIKPSAYFNPQTQQYKDFSQGAGKYKSGKLSTLIRALEENGFLEPKTEQKKTNTVFNQQAVVEYWQNRGIFNLESVSSNENAIFYTTHSSANTTQLFQFSKLTVKNDFNRLNPSNEKLKQKKQTAQLLYIPNQWSGYQNKALWITEGISDCLTLRECGFNTIAVRNAGAVSSPEFAEQLQNFLTVTKPSKIIIVPDPDAYKAWKADLPNIIKDKNLSWLDIDIEKKDDKKIDVNLLFKNLNFDKKQFAKILYNNLNYCNQTVPDFGIYRDYNEKCYKYKSLQTDGDNPKTDKKISNFLMRFGNTFQDRDTGEMSQEIQFITKRNAKTKIMPSQSLGIHQYFKEFVAKFIHHQCKIFKTSSLQASLDEITTLETRCQFCTDEIISLNKFGLIDDIYFFKNIAIDNKTKKIYHLNNSLYFDINKKKYEIIAEQAPTLVYKCSPAYNKETIEYIEKAFGFEGICVLAYNLAMLKAKPIIDLHGSYPHLYVYGMYKTGKSKILKEVFTLFGTEKIAILSSHSTKASIERTINKFQHLGVNLEDLEIEKQLTMELIGDGYGRHMKSKAFTDNTNRVKISEMNSFLEITTNQQLQPTNRVYYRNCYVEFNNKEYFDTIGKKYIDKVQELTKISNMVYNTILLKYDIVEKWKNYQGMIMNCIDDKSNTDYYLHQVPFCVGFDLMAENEDITKEKQEEYENKLIDHLQNDVEIGVDICKKFFEDFYHYEKKYERTDNNTQKQYTTIYPGYHYKVENNTLYIDLQATLSMLDSKGCNYKLIRAVLMGSFKANLDIYLGKSRTTLMGTQKHVESFNLQEIEKKYNLKFRYSLDEPIDIDPENKFSYAEDKNNPMDNGNLV